MILEKKQLQELYEILSTQKDDWHSKISNLQSSLLQSQSRYDGLVEEKTKSDVELEQMRIQVLSLQQAQKQSETKINEYQQQLQQLQQQVQQSPSILNAKSDYSVAAGSAIAARESTSSIGTNLLDSNIVNTVPNVGAPLSSTYLQSRLQALTMKLGVYNQ